MKAKTTAEDLHIDKEGAPEVGLAVLLSDVVGEVFEVDGFFPVDVDRF